MGIRIDFEIGHEASIRTKRTPEGFTHDWEVFVRSPNGDMSVYVEKIVFYLHDTFAKPKRVVKEPPYSVKESGYAGFNFPVEIYLKHSGEPRKISFNYDLGLHSSGPPILHKVPTSYEFHGVSDEFKQLLLKGGGIETSSSNRNNDTSSKSLNIDRSGQLTDKPKLGGGDISRKQKVKADDHRDSNSFLKNFAFVPLPKPTKISPDIRNNQVKSSPKASANVKFEKAIDKTALKSKHSPHKDKDKIDREKKDRDYEKKREEKRSKDKTKERDRSKDQGAAKRDRSPSPRRTPKREPSPKQISSPKPPSPKVSKQHDDKKFSSDYKQEKKSKKDKRDKSKDKDRDKRDHKIHPPEPTAPIDKDKLHKSNRDKSDQIKPKLKPPEPVDKNDKADKSEKSTSKPERSHDTEKHHRKHKKKDREKNKKDEKERERERDKKHERKDNVTRNDNKSNENEKVADNFNSKDKSAAVPELSNDDSSDSSSNASIAYEPPPPPTKKIPDTNNKSQDNQVDKDKSRLEQEKMRKSKKYKEKHKSTNEKDSSEKKRKRKLKEAKDGNDERPNKYAKEEQTVHGDGAAGASTNGPATQASTAGSRNVDVASGDDDTNSTGPITTTESYMRILKSLQESIMAMQDNSDLQHIVQLIARTGQYEITTQTFDFDLCALDRNTVKRLQDFFAIS